MSKDYITCHILDTVKGIPAAGVDATLSKLDGDFTVLAKGQTDKDGRISTWASGPVTSVTPGAYKIKFETAPYLKTINGGTEPFFPYVEIVFNVSNPPQAHYHIPLLLSPYAYHTYRGS